MTLLVLSYSTSWCQTNSFIPLTGDVDSIKHDSVLVSIDAIKKANAKLIEFKYEKEINEQLRGLVQTDSILIDALSTNLATCKINSDIRIKEITKQRNIAIGAGAGTSLLFLLLFIIAL